MSSHEVQQLHVDPTLCQAHGFCAELLPVLIHLDEWGYHVLRVCGLRTDIAIDLIGEAKRAVIGCPVGAFKLHKA